MESTKRTFGGISGGSQTRSGAWSRSSIWFKPSSTSTTRPCATVLDSGAIALYQWHASSAHLEELVRSAPSSAPISSLRFSLDGTRLQVLTADHTERILDATTLQPAPPPTCAWSSTRGLSPDGAWRAVIRDGRLVVEAAKP